MAYPYYNQPYMNYGNQYYQQQPMQQQIAQPMQQPVQQTIQPQQVYKPSLGLQGKSVDSLDVVKAMDIPLDGSISYFPLTDGTAIVTKQLQQDGTSKTMIYKPMEDKPEVPIPNYLTQEEFDKKIKTLNNDSLRNEMVEIKQQLSDLIFDFNEIKNELRNRKVK